MIGGQGAAGSAIAAAFRERGWRVLVAGRRPGADVLVDLRRPEGVREALGDADVAVNLIPDPALVVERSALAGGARMLNIADRNPRERRALRSLDSAEGTVVLNWGVIPGTTNLAAAELLARRPDADTVVVATSFATTGTSGLAGAEFLWRGIEARARHRTAKIRFAPGRAPRRHLEFAEGSDAWLGGLAEGRRARMFVRLDEREATAALLAANRVALCRRLPKRVFTARRRYMGGAESTERFGVLVAAVSRGRLVDAVTISGYGMYRCTGRVAVAGAEALLAGATAARSGCLDPDEVFGLSALTPALEHAGLSVRGMGVDGA